MKRILALLLALTMVLGLAACGAKQETMDLNNASWEEIVEDGRFTACGIDCAADAADGEYDIMLRPDCLHTEKEGNYRLTVESVSFRGSDTLVCFRAEDGTCWKKTYDHPVSWRTGAVLHSQVAVEHPVLFR